MKRPYCILQATSFLLKKIGKEKKMRKIFSFPLNRLNKNPVHGWGFIAIRIKWKTILETF